LALWGTRARATVSQTPVQGSGFPDYWSAPTDVQLGLRLLASSSCGAAIGGSTVEAAFGRL
jgi:hypothetical protein